MRLPTYFPVREAKCAASLNVQELNPMTFFNPFTPEPPVQTHVPSTALDVIIFNSQLMQSEEISQAIPE